MNERGARDVVLARSIEAADAARDVWSDADRAWASRAAAEIVGERASSDAYLARRASLVLERLAERHPRVRALARVPSARGWVSIALAIAAFVIGAAGVDIGAAHTINLLAPPVLALLAWNLAVYVALVAAFVARRRRPVPRPLRSAVTAWLGDVSRPLRKSLAPRPLAIALRRFATDRPALAMPLWQRRAARLLHVGAAALALGAVAGLYVRGIALEYRAAWQSTFLDATDVSRLLHVVLAPGAWLTGIAIPDASHLATIGGASAGENAAPWIHLYAATLAIVVMLPRAVLAAVAWIGERRLARRFPLPLESAYYRRLLHAWREGTAHVVALPYSFEVPAVAREGLATLMARVFEGGVDIEWREPTPYGGDALPDLPALHLAAAAAIFTLAATPEGENHGAFVESIRRQVPPGTPVVAIVDTSEFGDRFGANPRRIADRESAWRQLLEAHGAEPLFVRLAAPALNDAAPVLAQRLEHAAS
jgi:hypothetical protein